MKQANEEKVNAVALRWGWNEPTVRHFIARYLEKIDNNRIVKLVHKLPKPIKKVCLDFGRLLAIRELWNLEKALFDQMSK